MSDSEPDSEPGVTLREPLLCRLRLGERERDSEGERRRREREAEEEREDLEPLEVDDLLESESESEFELEDESFDRDLCSGVRKPKFDKSVGPTYLRLRLPKSSAFSLPLPPDDCFSLSFSLASSILLAIPDLLKLY